jgi:hypothetical protein
VTLCWLPLPLGEGWGEGLSIESPPAAPLFPALLPKGEGRIKVTSEIGRHYSRATAFGSVLIVMRAPVLNARNVLQ